MTLNSVISLVVEYSTHRLTHTERQYRELTASTNNYQGEVGVTLNTGIHLQKYTAILCTSAKMRIKKSENLKLWDIKRAKSEGVAQEAQRGGVLPFFIRGSPGNAFILLHQMLASGDLFLKILV